MDSDLSSLLQSVMSSKIASTLFAEMGVQQREKRYAPDSARLAFLSRMRLDAATSRQGARNMEDAAAMVTTAQAGVIAVRQMLADMRQTAVDALNAGTLAQYTAATTELEDYARKMAQTARATEFNGFRLLDGTAYGNGVFQLQAGNSALNEPLVNFLDSGVTGGQVVDNSGNINLNDFLDTSNPLFMDDAASAQAVINLIDRVSDRVAAVEAQYSNDIKSLGNLRLFLESQADIFDNVKTYHEQTPEKTPGNYLDMLLRSGAAGNIFTGNG
jgi:flagellin-like hook-associated protein FlgL